MATTDRVADLAQRTGRRLAVAESLTSGRVASELGKGPGSSEWFSGGVIAYRTEVKENVLGMQAGLDPCSSQCAVEIARGVRDLLGADLAVSVTGVGGPDPEDGHAPGTVYLGWATGEDTGSRLLELQGDPAEVVEKSTQEALALMQWLLEREEQD